MFKCCVCNSASKKANAESLKAEDTPVGSPRLTAASVKVDDEIKSMTRVDKLNGNVQKSEKISLEDKNASLEDKNTLENKDASPKNKNISLEDKNVLPEEDATLEDKDASPHDKNASLENKDVSLEDKDASRG